MFRCSRRISQPLQEYCLLKSLRPSCEKCLVSHITTVSPKMSGQAPRFRNILHQARPDRFQSVNVVDLLCDPTEKLQSLVDVPLYGSDDGKPFRPSEAEMMAAREIFTSRKPRDIKRLESTISHETAPVYHLPEVAFMGRSNVGKSSLIKAIFHASPYLNVPTSSQPGHTKTLRFYQVKDIFTLVDMPGYGKNQPKYFQECVGDFLLHRQNLMKVFLMYDSDTHESAFEECAYMEQYRVPYAIVCNKIDLLKEAARLKMVAQFRQMREQFTSPCCFPQPFLVSSTTGEGLAYIQSFIAYLTGNINVSGR